MFSKYLQYAIRVPVPVQAAHVHVQQELSLVDISQ